jgi:SsrA-binding protein
LLPLYYAKTVNIFNKLNKFDYEIIETFNAGIVLAGTEIKSIRLGKRISESFVIQQQRTFCNTYIEEYTLETNSTTKREAEEYFLKKRN